MVYFVKTESEPAYIKIGFTKDNPGKRVGQLQVGCPFRLSLTDLRNGSVHTEAIFHGHLKNFKATGEWFIYNDEVQEIINSIIRTFKISKVSITRNRTGLESKRDKKLTNQIMHLLDQGLTVNKVASELKINRCTVMRHSKAHRQSLNA